MRASAILRKIEMSPDGSQTFVENINQCNFDQAEVFSWTIINDEEGIPDYIMLITKNGISMEVEYDENVLSALAAEFRSRGVL